MVLRPLEYSDCVHDSPFFRETLQAHEKELENTAESIKVLMKACKRLLTAQKELSRAQHHVSEILSGFKIELIGDSTEDEAQIIGAFKEFASLINSIEEQREMFLGNAEIRLLDPLEHFRNEQVQATKDSKKTFEKCSTSYCKSLETYLGISTKRKDSQLQEADEQMDADTEHFLQTSCQYVRRLQDVQLRKKFDFVEPLLGFMRDQMTFYHHGYEACTDYSGRFQDLQIKLQLARDQYELQTEQTEELISKVIEKATAGDTSAGQLARQGYNFLQKPRKGGLGVQSIKHYCQFIKDECLFVMFPYNQQQGKLSNPESFKLDSCTRRPTDSTERRFCFDVTSGDKTYTLQALTSKDRTLWMEVLDGREPDYMMIDSMKRGGDRTTGILAPASQLQFVEKCIAAVEARGLDEEGVYRLSGVASKSEKLMKICIEKGKFNDKVNLMDTEWEVKTITSALKNFFRNREALLTFKLYPEFLAAAKEQSPNDRYRAVAKCASSLPPFNRKVLAVLLQHLHKVTQNAVENKMHASNIGVVFGPTLMRPMEDSVAGIMDIKYQNIVVEMMVERYAEMFSASADTTASPVSSASTTSPMHANGSSSTSLASAAATQPSANHQTLRRTAPVAPSHAPPSAPGHAPTSPAAPSHPAPAAPTTAPPPAPGKKPQLPARKPTDSDLRTRTHSEVPRQPSKPPPPPPTVTRHQTAPNMLMKSTPGATSGAGGAAAGAAATTANGPSSAASAVDLSKPVAPVAPQPRRRPGSVTDVPGTYQREPSATTPTGPEKGRVLDEDGGGATVSAAPPAAPPRRGRGTSNGGRRARAIYPCIAEDDCELSFDVDDIFHEVVPSTEPGWYECTLRNRTGLVPENYIELIAP